MRRSSTPLWQQSARDLAAMIARGEASAVETTDAFIARIEGVEPRINAMPWRRFDAARAEARSIDAARERGELLGPLAGVPIAIKECIDVEGTPSTYGSRLHENHRADHDARAVHELKSAGAIILGKTNASQALLFMEADNPLYGRTNHPEDPERSPGGSSGGQAAIIAAGGATLGLGTDIGGSSRNPAACCGVVGFKPTAGRLPDMGTGSVAAGQQVVASQLGVLARDALDLHLALSIATGGDAPHVAGTPPLGDPRAIEVRALAIGWFDDDGTFAATTAARRAVREAADALAALGARVTRWTPPDGRAIERLFYGAMTADGGASWRRFLGSGPRDARVREIELATTLPRALIRGLLRASGRRAQLRVLDAFSPGDADAYFRLAQETFDLRAQALASLGSVDAVISPAAALPALRHGASRELGTMGVYTTIYNVLGWPAGVVPWTRVAAGEESERAKTSDPRDRVARSSERGSAGLPVGVQIAARPWQDHVALAVMNALFRPLSPRG